MSAADRHDVTTSQEVSKGPGHHRHHPLTGPEQDHTILHVIKQQILDETNAPLMQQEVQELKDFGRAVQDNPRLAPAQYYPPAKTNPTMVPDGNHGVAYPKT